MARQRYKGTTGYSVLPQMKELERKFKGLARAAQRQALADALESGAEIVKEKANQNAPGPNVHIDVDPQKVDTLASVSVGPDKEHWFYRFFETGAQPHEIGPKRRSQLKAIRFDGNVIVAIVEHPGMAARPFLRPALADNEARVAAAVGEALVMAIEEASA